MARLEKSAWEEKLAYYDRLVESHPDLVRKGKTMPYTSANGHMFSQLNKAGEIGIRLSKEDRERFLEEQQTSLFTTYGTVMKEYVLVPEHLWQDFDLVSSYMYKGYQYAKSLKPK